MVGKNNKRLLDQKANQHFTRWSLRRLNIGVVSVAVASGFFIAGGFSQATSVEAATVEPRIAVEAVNDNLRTTDDEDSDDSIHDKALKDTEDNLAATHQDGDTAWDKSAETDDATPVDKSDEEAADTSAEDESTGADKADQAESDEAPSDAEAADQEESDENASDADQADKEDSDKDQADKDKKEDKSKDTERATVNTGDKEMDNETHFNATGIEDSTLRYANTVFSGVNDDGTINLTVTKWATGSTGWGTDASNPYAGKFLLSFQRKEFFEQIGSIVVKSKGNVTAFTSEADGALWSVDIRTTTFQSGLIGVVTNSEIVITLKNGQTLESLGLDDDKLAFSSVWMKGNGAIAEESISNGYIERHNAHVEKPDSEKHGTDFTKGAMGNKVLVDGDNMVINSVHTFKPNQNFIQTDYKWVLYIIEQIPKELLPYIDLDNIELGVSDVTGNFTTKNPIKLKIDENGLVDSRYSPEISIIGQDTVAQREAARVRLDRDVFYGVLGQSRNFTIKYHLKDSVTLQEFAKELNNYVTQNNKQLTFESWLEADYLNEGRPLLDKPDGGAPTKELVQSYSNGFLQVNDTDKDGLFDFVEFEEKSDIHKVDTDGDGAPDGQEFLDDDTDMLDGTSYIPGTPTTTETTINPSVNVTIQGTAAKPTYDNPADPTQKLDVTNPVAGNMIIKLEKTDGTVVAQTTIAFDDLMAGNYEITIPANTLKDGETVQLVAYSPDGKHSVKGSTLSVKETDADKNNPQGQKITVDKNTTPDAALGIANKDQLPTGTKYDWIDPVDTTTYGDKNAQIKVTYPDQSSEVVDIVVHVNSDTEINTAESQSITVNKGEQPAAELGVKNKDQLPNGTKYDWVTPVDTTTAGDKNVQIKVTYPDGTTDTLYTIVHVKSDTETYNPFWTNITVNKNETPVAADGITNKDQLPNGTQYDWVNPVDTTTPGDKPAQIKVTYPDGTTDNVSIKVHVNSDAEVTDPQGQAITVDKNEQPDANAGIANKDQLPGGTTITWKDPVDTTTAGDHKGTIEVTYPDGSKDEVEVDIHVNSDTETYTAQGQDMTVNYGEPVPNAKDGISNSADLPLDAKYNWKSEPDMMKLGEQEATIIVSYVDGTTDEVTIKVNVVDNRTDTEKNDPVVEDETVELGGKVDVTDNVTNLDELPEGTKVTDVTPAGTIDTNKPGDYTGKIEISYPDGSKETIDVPIHIVDNRTDADKFDPEAGDITVKPGEKPNADDAIINKDDLPDGTIIDWKDPVDTTQPGDHQGTIEITYPDGSKEEIDTTIHVNVPETDADKYTPVVEDEAVEMGGKVDVTDNVINLDELPEGTKVTDVTPEGTVDTNKPGDYTGKIEISYPDGSKETIDVPIHIMDNRTDADKFDPETGDITVKPGEKPNADDAIINKDDLPDGTIIDWKDPVDTTQPGDHQGTIEITYPDGSKEEVDIHIIVKDDSDMNDQNHNGMSDQDNESHNQPSDDKDNAPTSGDNEERMTLDERVEAMSHLPQTGAEGSSQANAAIGLLTLITGLFVLGGTKRRKEEE
ncbi:MAG: Rib/alpha-like domain-containing protein [Aerococcus sp.]|nr:Rib/alpha-like domain-containing protein [Aerococcus sp.]